MSDAITARLVNPKDPKQIQAFAQAAVEEIEHLQRRIVQLEAELAEAGRGPNGETDAERVLNDAHAKALSIIRSADEYACRTRAEVDQYADATRDAAESFAERTKADAQAFAQATRASMNDDVSRAGESFDAPPGLHAITSGVLVAIGDLLWKYSLLSDQLEALGKSTEQAREMLVELGQGVSTVVDRASALKGSMQ